MKKEKSVSFMLTEDEHQLLVAMMAKSMLEESKHYTLSSYTRHLILSILNGKPDTKHTLTESEENEAKFRELPTEQDAKPEEKQEDEQSEQPVTGPILNFDDLSF